MENFECKKRLSQFLVKINFIPCFFFSLLPRPSNPSNYGWLTVPPGRFRFVNRSSNAWESSLEIGLVAVQRAIPKGGPRRAVISSAEGDDAFHYCPALNYNRSPTDRHIFLLSFVHDKSASLYDSSSKGIEESGRNVCSTRFLPFPSTFR